MNEYPLSFYDISWLAVKKGQSESIAQVTSLTDPIEMTWEQGLEAVCGDFWDFQAHIYAHLSRVFITPIVNNWRLAVGGWFGPGNNEEAANDASLITGYCEQLSEVFGEACAFTTQGRMDWYAWILARSGKVYRAFVWDGKILLDEGTPTAGEKKRYNKLSSEGWGPGEETVMAIARESSVCPLDFGPSTPSVGKGYLFTTPWGREHGLPQRPLG